MIAPNVGNNEHERYVFVADEVVFQILHPPITDQESDAAIRTRIITALNNFLRPGGGIAIGLQLPENDWRNRLVPPAFGTILRMLTFSSPIQREGTEHFSLIPIKLVDKDDLTPDDVLNLLKDAYNELGGDFLVPGGDGDDNNEGDDDEDENEKEKDGKKHKDDDDRKDDEDEKGRFRSIPLDDTGEIRLKSISPNWLASDLHHGGATGGPGSLPASKPSPSAIPPQFHLEGPINSLTNYRQPGAQVVILDTARQLTEFPGNIQAMFSVDPAMDVIPYPYPAGSTIDMNELQALVPYAELPHHYKMPDHGTFIASIIRTIAPTAKVILRQVLNLYGVGSFISIANGVLDAVNQRGDTRLIINCSFMLDRDLDDLKKQWTVPPELIKPDIQRLLGMSMRDVFNWAVNDIPNVTVVASAGNDGKNPSTGKRWEARYPAAFYKVISVAALPKNYPKNSGKYKPASYSNSAHSGELNKNQALSIATFGGELVSGSISPKDGVLGVYIGELPMQNTDGTFPLTSPVNTTGWAEWSGTSFAAPIITGLLAAQPSDASISTATTAIADPPSTAVGENVVIVRQG